MVEEEELNQEREESQGDTFTKYVIVINLGLLLFGIS